MRLAAALLLAMVLPSTAQAQEPPPCAADRPAVLTLFLPAEVPVGFPTGFFVQRTPGLPDDPTEWNLDRGRPIVAETELLEGERSVDRQRLGTDAMTDFGRWPLRFGRADQRLRVTLTYGEEDEAACTRTIVAESRATPSTQPRISVRVRVRRRLFKNRNGDTRRAVHVVVTGRVRGAAPRPIRIQIGPRIRTLVRARRGRLRAVLRYAENAGIAKSAVRVQALYPGDTPDLFPCDDLLTTGPDDACRVPRRKPR